MNGRTDGRTYIKTDRQTDRRTYRQTDRSRVERLTHTYTGSSRETKQTTSGALSASHRSYIQTLRVATTSNA